MYSRLLVPLLCTEIQPGLVLFSLFPLNFGSRHLKFLLRMISCCCSCIAPMALFSFALVGFFTSKSYRRHKSQYYQLHLDGCGSCVLHPQCVSKQIVINMRMLWTSRATPAGRQLMILNLILDIGFYWCIGKLLLVYLLLKFMPTPNLFSIYFLFFFYLYATIHLVCS